MRSNYRVMIIKEFWELMRFVVCADAAKYKENEQLNDFRFSNQLKLWMKRLNS